MTIMEKIRGRGREPQVEQPEPLFPHFSGLPTTFDPRSRRISEAAAGAAQYVIDLEAEVGRLKEENGFERNRNSLLEETTNILHEQVAQLESENRRLRDSMSRCSTKLQVSGQIVLDALAEAKSWGVRPADPVAEAPAPAITEEAAS
jgi:hypothetical protein